MSGVRHDISMRLLFSVGGSAFVSLLATAALLGAAHLTHPTVTRAIPVSVVSTAATGSYQLLQSPPALTPEDIELQHIQTEIDSLDAHVRDTEETPNQRLLDDSLAPLAGLIVGVLGIFGVVKQVSATRKANRLDNRQRVAEDRWRQGKAVIDSCTILFNDALKKLNALRNGALVQSVTPELTQDATDSVVRIGDLEATFATVGIDVRLLDDYVSQAQEFIRSAVRRADVGDIQGYFDAYLRTEAQVRSALAQLGASLNRRVERVESELSIPA